MKAKEKEKRKGRMPLLLLLVGLAMAGLFFFIELSIALQSREVEAFDTAVSDFFESMKSSFLDQFMNFITALGSVWFLATLSILTLLFLLLKVKDKWTGVFFALAMGLGALSTKLLKLYFERERPPLPPGVDIETTSYPSGHALSALIYYGFIVYLVIQKGHSNVFIWTSAILASLLVVLIGASRIYLGIHYPSDVVAGLLAGAVWLFMCVAGLGWIKR